MAEDVAEIKGTWPNEAEAVSVALAEPEVPLEAVPDAVSPADGDAPREAVVAAVRVETEVAVAESSPEDVALAD